MHRTSLGLSGLARTRYPVHIPAPCILLPTRLIRSSARITTTDRSLEEQLSIYLQQQQLSRDSRSSRKQLNMSFLLPGLRRGLVLSTPLILSTPLLAYQFRNMQRIRCDGPDPLTKITSDLKNNYTNQAKTPVVTQSGAVNPRAIRQISMGSILGVIGGLGISVFSKPLAILIGLGIFALQFIESRGIHVIPYSFLQRRLKSMNVRSLVQDNVAFKLSFGLTFAMAAFAEF
ncbi:hypothetical protein yc1106_03062 [Curvularia clavata]|uniref:Uncharacterized protein n=1 Tax=Curvularia clavata TaxID=95742 RepID=A0A9Q9DQ14_CURCL|nr:hypothetical protein yc1106_03062 [Curvularia clavata]